ncbi:hypothetical protein [Motilibacter aurantiacus]|uniref:hypothetical protein n=1 Tax=Motilibacter aurantiacus TaxID=2714955 RepID=UPI00140B66C4|nr:hypothetical protein [Motilibacter aurantiacus]NHC46893.1 hypothetical protein [Motilibacter aurantiacus]
MRGRDSQAPRRTGARRPARVALAAAALSPLLLTACEKPVPSVTVYAGSSSQRAEATCWNHDEAALPADEVQRCATQEGTLLEVHSGDVIGISVDKEVAEAGWRPPGAQEISHETYYSLPLGQELTEEVALDIVAFDESGEQPRGVWRFRLTSAS